MCRRFGSRQVPGAHGPMGAASKGAGMGSREEQAARHSSQHPAAGTQLLLLFPVSNSELMSMSLPSLFYKATGEALIC